MVKTKLIIKWHTALTCLREYSLQIALSLVTLSLIALMAVANYVHLTSPDNLAVKQQQTQYFQQKNAEREWQRLSRKHGYPAAVIVKEGQPPYYFDKEGRKCIFN
jgi:hypothetical protein